MKCDDIGLYSFDNDVFFALVRDCSSYEIAGACDASASASPFPISRYEKGGKVSPSAVLQTGIVVRASSLQ